MHLSIPLGVCFIGSMPYSAYHCEALLGSLRLKSKVKEPALNTTTFS